MGEKFVSFAFGVMLFAICGAVDAQQPAKGPI